MKKKNIINLIKYYAEDNDAGFRNEAYQIAHDFDASGDYQLAEYIMALLSDSNTFVPQMEEHDSPFFEKIEKSSELLVLPEIIMQDLTGVANAILHNVGINKFLFEGEPGTGKTEAVKQLAGALNREVYMVDFTAVVDSKLGETQKNITRLFKEINSFAHPEKVIVLFDEIDAIALDRTNSNDLREMGRATSTLLKNLDYMNNRIVLIATTNLFKHFDKALVRRFDSVVNFNRYSSDELVEVAEALMDNYIKQFKITSRDKRLFRKIITLMNPIPYPGDLKNLIRTSIAFSNPKDGFDYFRRLYTNAIGSIPNDLADLQKQGFTIREIEILTGVSKSSVSRELKGINEDE